MTDFIFRQLYEGESSTYTYILGCSKTREAIIIDAVLETVDRDLKLISELGLTLKYVFETHVHADHITGSGEIRNRTGAKIVHGQTGVCCADVHLKEGESVNFGEHTIRAIPTPGHTQGCTSYYLPGFVFTGDALLIRSCGRTDFQGGSPAKLYESVMTKLYTLPPETYLYPAHDYAGRTSSTIGEEMAHNIRLFKSQTVEPFVKMMNELNLPYPKKIDVSLPANERCGEACQTEISVEKLLGCKDKFTLIDVRSEDEYGGGHIEGATLHTLGGDLLNYLKIADINRPHVFICHSGKRSAQARELASEQGLTCALNMTGGMMAWTGKGYDIVS